MPKGKRKKERIVICVDCGKEVATRGSRTLRCKECAKKKNNADQQKERAKRREIRGENPESNYVWFCDSPENIQKCLNCKKPTCRNCLQSRKKKG